MNMHSEKRKFWKRGVSLLLAALTVFNLSSQGLILTAQALGRGEVEAPEISVTFSPEQLPGSMANQVSDRVYMLPTKAEMSLQLTLQPGYTKGYASGAYVRIELPYFYVDRNGQIIMTDQKPDGVPESALMGVEAKVVGDTGNWIVDTAQGEAAPVTPATVQDPPVVTEPEQKSDTSVPTESEQETEPPMEVKPEQKPDPSEADEPAEKVNAEKTSGSEQTAQEEPKLTPSAKAMPENAVTAETKQTAEQVPEAPAEKEPEQVPEVPAEKEPEQVPETPAEKEPEQVPEVPAEKEPEQVPEAPAEKEPEQVPETPAEKEPEQIPEQPPEAIAEPVDDGEGYRRGVLQLVAANEMVHLDPKPLSFAISLRFFGDVPENVTGSVRLGAGYEHYFDEAGNASVDGFQIVPGSASEKDIHNIDIVNSNLKWDYSIEQVGKSVLWDKYNYITYHVKIANTSGADTTSKIDKFTLILTVQSYQNTPGKGGVLEEDMMQWEYNPNGDPIRNEDYGPDSRDKSFVGVPNEGGVLVHDVTDMTQEERANLDLTNFTNLGETLPYQYSLPGVIGVDIAEDKGELVPEHMANGADKRSYREYYVSVPYANNLQGSVTTGTVYRPTIYFGGRNVPWTKQVKINGEFVKRAPDFAHQKYVLNDEGSKLEEKDVPIGGMDTYYLGEFHNIGNVPAFRPVVTDTLPEDFREKRIDLILDPSAEGAPCDLENCFQPEPLEFVFEDGKGEEHYVSATEMGLSPSKRVDPTTQVTTYSYNIANATETYLERHPDYSDWTFSRKIRVHLREELGVNVVLPGRVAVVGEAPLPKNYVNTIDTDYVTKYWQPDTAQEAAHYEEEIKTVASDTAALLAIPTAPQVDGHGVLRKNGKETVGAVGEYQRVPFNENASALRYVLANNSPSVMDPAVLRIGPMVDQQEGSNTGFVGNEIRISKELLRVGTLREVSLTDIGGRVITFAAGEWEVNPDGDILLNQDQWKDKSSQFGQLQYVELRFDRFGGNVSVDQNAAIDIRGTLTQRGDYKASAEWRTNYGIAELQDKERYAYGDACLNAVSAEPFITATAHSGDKQGSAVDVLFKDQGYYQFVAENRSETSIGHSEVTVDLQSVQDMDPGGDVRVQGFRTEQIFIDSSYTKAGVLNRIDLYDWNQNPEKDAAKVTLTLDQLLQYQDAENNLVIPQDAFQNIEYLKFVRVSFDDFYGNVMAPTEDHPENTAFVIQLHGSTEWLDLLTARGALVPREEFYGPQYSVHNDAHFRVERSYQDIHSHLYYNNVTDEITRYSNNSDLDRAVLAVPYDRDFVFRNELLNKSLYTLDDVDTVFTMPITKSQDGGFHTTAIRLYRDLLQNYGTFETITVTDVKGKQLVLTYDSETGTFKNGDAEIGVWNADYVQFNTDEFKLADIQTVMLTGKDFAYTGDPAEEGKQFYVEFCGYEDAPLGTNWYQLAESTHYLDGERKIEAFRLKKNDDAQVYVSKMYFDTVITAGYNDNEPDKKFSAVTTPLEDVREGDDDWFLFHTCTPKWGDNTELEVGYKALGSFMVDFRQYLNVGTNYPTDTSTQEHSGMPYVKTESLNTAANVEIKVDLPHKYFDTYYIKVDPRVKGYLDSMTVIRANGTSEVIHADEMQWSAVETGDNGAFCRLNLVKEDPATRYTDVESDYYKAPENYDAGNPVKQVILNLNINQDAAHQDENGDMISNAPDYGTWYEDSDESSKYMFEFTGRFYRMEATPNGKGQVYATADAKVTIGGGRSRERVETSNGYDSKSDWSFKNYYRYYYYWENHGCTWSNKLFRAANLYSKTYVHVMRDHANVVKGATTSPNNQSNTSAYFGLDNQYQVSFFRTSDDDPLYATTNVLPGKIWYSEKRDRHDIHAYQDSADWNGKVGYADEIILRDTLPPLRPHDEYGFYGFKTTGLELKPELAQYLTSIELKVSDVDKEGKKSNPYTITVDASELIDDQGTRILKFAYATEATEGENPEPTVVDGTLNLAMGQFVESFDVHIKNLMGNGEYTKELGSKGTPDHHGNRNQLDMIVHGKPYVIHVKDPDRDGTNTMTAINKVDYEKTEYTNPVDDALLMGYLIKFVPGYRLEYTNPDRYITDYAPDNLTPNLAEFGVELWNDRNTGSNEGVEKRARISSASVNNTVDSHYRLQHIYLPKEFVDGNWFRVKNLVLTINGKEHTVSLDQVNLKDSTKHSDCYEIDVEQIIRDHMKDGYVVEYSNRTTDFKPYVKAHVSSFRLTFEALNPSADDSATVLEHGEYLTANRKKGYAYRYDGVYVDRNAEEFKNNVWTEESTPSFGKAPDVNQNHWMTNEITAEFKSVDVNADIYHKPVSPGTQTSSEYAVRNRAAVMDLIVTRDTDTGFAYDLDKKSQSRQEVNKDQLLPYDYVEYTARIINETDAGTYLNQPTLHFRAPEGQQVVGWEFVSSTDATITADDLTGLFQTERKPIPAVNGADYSLTADAEDSLYRELAVTVNRRLEKGEEVVVRIKTQLLPEPAGGYEGKTFNSDIWLTAEHNHSYPQYMIRGNYSGYHGGTRDLGGETSYYRNDTAASNEKPEYELRGTNSLTFFADKLNVTYTFGDKGYSYDNQDATIHVDGIENHTGHDLENMVVTISFLDAKGYQGFALTQVPDISYPESLPENADRADVKIEYWCNEKDGWVVGTGTETEEFLRTVKKIRWTYNRVNAADNAGAMPQFAPVDLKGVALYADLRPDNSGAVMAENYHFTGTAQIEHIHHHQEDKQIDSPAVALEQDRVVTMTGTSTFDQVIFRENPEVDFYTQVFNTAEAAENAGVNRNAAQKRGYRPGETMWQKLTLHNLHMVDSSGNQINDQGVVLNPVFYDKLPEYLSSEDLVNGNFHIVWKDINGAVKNTDMTLTSEVIKTVQEKDYGGGFIYPKSNGSMATYYGRGFDDFTPNANNTRTVNFTVYKLAFRSADGSDVRVEVGDTIEIWYSVTAREDNLPMVFVDEDRNLATVNDQHPAYFPRMGEYYSYTDYWAHPLLPSIGGKVDNASRQMDLDYLLHDIGFSADKNEQVDRWEFLNGSRTLIPGSSSNSTYWEENEYGSNGVLFDQDINEANDHQYVSYHGTRSLSGKSDRDRLPESFNYTLNGEERDWWSKVLSLRTKFNQNWDGAPADRTPILWSQTRLHLQKAWLLTASEMTGSNVHYMVNNPNYPAGGHWSDEYRKVTHDQNRTALEYDENFRTTLHAVNYGDWKLDGVEFTYIMPRGIEPQIKDGNYGITAQILSAVGGAGSESYTSIQPENVVVEVLQSPETGFKGYGAPEQVQDPLWTNPAKWSYYGEDGLNTVPWAFKITVKQPLNQWFNRGNAEGYKIKVDIPSHVYLNNENEAWYDRVITRPYVAPDSQNHYYYQIFDIDHWEGTTRKSNPHNQIYGMDYLWYANNYYEYMYASPNTPYIGGFNIQNNEVVKETDETMGVATNNVYPDYATAGKLDLYAQTGTAAVMRKPFVRLWATTGEDLTGATQRDYYTDIEGQRNRVNIHVENKYWLDEFAFNGNYYYGYQKYLHNYETDGGSRGTLFAPVITNVLPFGVTPVAKDGTLFSTDNAVNATKELEWYLYGRDVHPGANVRAVTEADAAEMDKYDVSVTYEQIPCYDDAGEQVERTEGRYVVRIVPKQATDCSAPDQEVRLASQDALIFSIMTFTEQSPRIDTDKKGIQEDLRKNYQDNRTYLSSRLPGFKFIVDDDISGNHYQVGSYAYSENHARDIDPRLDAVKQYYSWGYRGNLPDDRLTHSYESQRSLLGKQRRFTEVDDHNVEDYCTFEDSSKDLNYKALLTPEQKDFNANGANTHLDAKKDQPYSDIGVMNTLKIRTSTPRLAVESLVGATKEENGISQGEVVRPFQYSEDVWFSAKIKNAPSSSGAYHEMGGIRHAKMVVSFRLPESVSYSGTADWNVHNNDGDPYNNPDDYYVEYYDPTTKQTYRLTEAEMREAGWGVEVIDIDNSEEWDVDNQTHGGQIVTFEITTPKTDGFTDYHSYIQGEKPAGYIPSGAILNFKIRTRVDNLPKDVSLESGEQWRNGDHAEVYVTIHDTDGKFALRENGTFINEEAYLAGEKPAAGAYNGFEVEFDGHKFHEQKQELITWVTTPAQGIISDAKDDAGALTVDHTTDGVYDVRHVADDSGSFTIQKPYATVRLDTGKLRPRVNDPDSDRVITEDPHVKSAYTMTMRLDQAVNQNANVNTFIVNYNIPYYGTSEGTPEPAPAVELNKLMQFVSKIRTGLWELPEGLDPERAAVLTEHMKVYVYALLLDDPAAENGAYYYPGSDDYKMASDGKLNGWKIIGNEQGYALTDNAEIVIQPDYQEHIYQLRWVVKTEPFTDAATGLTYTEEQAPIYYPVPAGFRLDVDADDAAPGKQEMDDVDPDRVNKDEPTENVKANSAFIEINTHKIDTNGVFKHTNHFATVFAKFDDMKYTSISKRARAGFYVDPELPTVNLTIKPMYFSGNVTKGYKWKNDLNVDPQTSKVMKYIVGYENMGPEIQDISIDNATNPTITVATPYVATLNENRFEYMLYRPYSPEEAVTQKYYIGDNYQSNRNLDAEKPQWTWYLKDADGSLKPPDCPEVYNQLQLIGEPEFVRKAIDGGTNMRTIVNYHFEGYLKPGQTVYVEMMVPIEELEGNAVPVDMLQCKAFGFKKGNFDPYIQPGSSFDNLNYEYDTNDVNNNGNQKDMAITRLTNAIVFKSTESIVQNKSVTTELDSNVTGRAVPVPEGKDFEYKISIINKSGSSEYNQLVLYDVLPYEDDVNIKNLTSQGEKIPRDSKWNGWLRPDSLRVLSYMPGVDGQTEESEVDPSQYEIWVGPIVRNGGSYEIKEISDLPTQEQLNTQEFFNQICASNAEKEKYFVRLSEVQAMPEGAQKEAVVKGIRAVWVQMDENYVLSASARLRLSFMLHTPLNLPMYTGTLDTTPTNPNSPNHDYNQAVKDYTAWNTFVSRWNRDITEQARAGAYPNAPSGRGYIGSYVWHDLDYSGVPDSGEGEYGQEAKTGRIHLNQATVDLDFDGVPDDPGVNGVKVQLLNENGFLVNREGQAIAQAEDGKYILIDPVTGEPSLIENPDGVVVYQYSKYGGPVEYVTESDYYGREGYFILSNLLPGNYRLRYTFPEIYQTCSVTTTKLGADQATGITVYRDGKVVYGDETSPVSDKNPIAQDRLTVQTDLIKVEAVAENTDEAFRAYDQKMTAYNVGVALGHFYGGTVWLDETDHDGHIESDGYLADTEPKLGNVEVSVYDTDDLTKPCLDADSNPAVFTTGEDGQYLFRLKPGHQYLISVKDQDEQRLLKPTPWTFTNDPTEDDEDNDLSDVGTGYQTKVFTAKVPLDASGKPIYQDDTLTYQAQTNIDLGLINAGRGYLGKFVWDDSNYNGIMDADEKGIPGVVLTLESYYMDDQNQWVSLGERDVTTNAAGAYVFENVMSYHTVDGVRYLTGYKVRIDPAKNPDLYETYAITHYQANGTPDSDLISKPDSENRYYLSEDYIIIAIDANAHTTDENRKSYGGKNYDISDAKIILDYDAGFTKYEYGEVSGMIWEDNGADANRYNGILDQDETGLANVKVYLEQYVKDADGNYQKVTNGVAADGTAYTDGLTAVTDAQGEYHFNRVPLFVRIDGAEKLCYYRVRAELPDDSYAVTRYRQDENQTDSHWITNQYPDSENYLTTPEEDYFLMAELAGDLQNKPYIQQDGKDVYDIVHTIAPVTGYDGGILHYETAALEGIVWNDADYDGIQDPDESGIYNQEVLLERYYHDGTQWQKDNSFASVSAWTDTDGVYTFNGLQTHVMVNGQAYLAGYRLQLKQLPEGYAVSRYMMGEDRTKDSDLLADTLALVRDDEYLILAKEAVGDINGVESYTVRELNDEFHDGIHYDLLTAQSHSGQDGGIKQLPTDQVIGRVWEDADYNGIQNDGELGIQGQNVMLERFYYDNVRWKKDDSAPILTAVTDANGIYTFTGLQTHVMVDGKAYLAGYQLKLDQIPDHLAVTRYRVGDDRTVDSDLERHALTLQRAREYLILADHAEKNTADGVYSSTAVTVHDMYHKGEVFDLLTSKPITDQDGGLTSAAASVISGVIWEDVNYNGIREDAERRIPGVSVKLYCDYFDADTQEWKPYRNFAATTVLTDDTGVYTFEHLANFATIDGEHKLLGYRVQVEAVPDGYDVTRYRVGDDRTADSDLRHDNLNLVRDGEYLVLVNEATGNFSSNVTITDADGREVTYDLTSVKRYADGQDGGLVAYQAATLTGRIWDDQNYNGTQDTDEIGVPNVEVELKSFYYDGTQWQSADRVAAPATTVTGADGEYWFENLPVYVEVGGQKYLAGYQVTVVDPDVFNHYDITYYQVGDDKAVDSDLRHEDHALVKPGEYLILAQEAKAEGDQFNHTAVIVNDEYHNNVTYDYLTAQSVSGQDGGLVNYDQHSVAVLTGRIWEDLNYNGIQDAEELGIAGVTVALKTSYYDGTQWQEADIFAAPVMTETGDDGVYRFENLPTYVVVDGQKYLAGYQVAVDETTVPETYGITYYHVGDDKAVDSDLRYEDYALVQPGEYLIMAEEAVQQADGSYNHTTVTVNDEYHDGITYDYLTAHDVSGQDGGLVAYQAATLTGRIWEDLNYNGIQDAEELGIAGVTVALKTSYYDGTQWQEADIFVAPATTETGDDGVYRFENLPAYVVVDGQKYLAGYQVAVDDLTVPATYGITYYQVGDDKAVDSDLRYEDYALVQPGEYLIMAEEAVQQADGSYNYTTVTVNDEYHDGITYDYLTAHDVSGQDGGLVAYQAATLTGRIWEDLNYNGIQDAEELGIAGVTVALKTSYYDGTQWQEADIFAAPVMTETGDDGVYRFENLPTYVVVDGQKYLAGYQVAVDETTVPETYGITYYHVGDDKAVDSDLRYEDYALVQPGEYLIMAEEAVQQADGSYNYTTVTVNDEYHDGITYDYLTAHDVSGQDGGLTQMSNGSLSGRIWKDLNYNGIQDLDETGIADVAVKLNRFYLVDGEWMLDAEDVAMVNTDANGVYLFENLPVFVEKDGPRYLAGYQISVADMSEDWAVTRYRQGINQLMDSDLRLNGMLVRDGEYITVAEYGNEDLSNEPYTVTVTDLDGVTATYDLLKGRHAEGQDGGITTFDNGSISGTVWVDQDMDGLQNHRETGKPGVNVELAQYIRKDGEWVQVEDFHAVQTTDADGYYCFDNLPVFLKETDENGEIVRYLTGYRLQLQKLPEGYKVSAFRQNDGVDDSKLLADSLRLIEPTRELDGCLVIAGSTNPEISLFDSMDENGGVFYQQEGFDLTKSVNIDQMNAGIWKPSALPQTGDNFNIGAAGGMFLASGLLGLLLLKKRRKSRS